MSILSIESLKELGGILTKAGKIDLYREILALQDIQQSDIAEKARLARENDTLSLRLRELDNELGRLQRRRAMTFVDGAYWVIEGESRKDGPFCPKCLDGAGHLEMRMTDRNNGFLVCVSGCRYSAAIPGAPKPQWPVAQGRRSSFVNGWR